MSISELLVTVTIPDDSDVRRSICVFCGSSRGANPAYSEAARNLGAILAAEGRRLVYGGGNVGLTGVVADAVLEAGGTVVGVIPQHLLDLEVGHRGVTELRVVHSMHERKEQMSTLADAFVLLTPRSRRPRSLPHRDLETAWESG